MKETHPYQVRSWRPGVPQSGYWQEECRCKTSEQASRIAWALHHGEGLVTAYISFSGEKLGVTYLGFYPDRASAEHVGAIDEVAI